MAMLVILLPTPRMADAATADALSAGALLADASAPLAWLLSADGLGLGRQGDDIPSPWPKADSVVAVVPALAQAWHRLVLPKAPASQLRAALGGVLEEQLLVDDEQAHLALAPFGVPGTPTWVAALHKPWLLAQLARLAASGLVVDRVVPAWAPSVGAAAVADGATPAGHFFSAPDASGNASTWLALQDADGAMCLPLAGGLARQLQARWSARQARFTSTPAADAAAEHWLGAPVAVRTEAEIALAAARSSWNLLQFDLVPQNRGSLALGKLGRQWAGPAFAMARRGLLALLLIQLVGLNVMAWQQQTALGDKRAAMDALLRSAHPQVRAVLDAPVQMQRETAALRAAAGVPGDDDFEPMLAALAGAWPDGQAPVAQLRFEPGRLSLPAAGWPPPLVDQLRARLQTSGWALASAEGRLDMQRAAPAAVR